MEKEHWTRKRAARVGAARTLVAGLAAIVAVGLAIDESAARSLKSPSKFEGMASYYRHSGRTASGIRFNPNGFTAAHRTLPFGTKVRVTEPRSGRNVIVTINDRGPFLRGRVLDLSLGAARELGITGRGVSRVRAEVL